MRQIDADALTILLHDNIDGLDEEFPNDKQVKPYMCGVRMALSFIDTAPTIDAVPVIRCEECKHLVVLNERDLYAHCKRHGIRFKPFEYDTRTNYCSWAERKEDD